MKRIFLIGIITYASACINSGNCSNHGLCRNETCLCFSRYVTFPKNNELQCNYLQKSQKSAFNLAFFYIPGASMGVGELYLDNVGTAQMLLFWFFAAGTGVCWIELIKRYPKYFCRGSWFDCTKKKFFPTIHILLFVSIPTIWCIFWFKVMIPTAIDGNGAPLFNDFSAITIFNHVNL